MFMHVSVTFFSFLFFKLWAILILFSLSLQLGSLMSSETNGSSPERKLKKHPLEYDPSASSDVFMANTRQKVCVIRDFPEGCGPFIKQIVLAHSMKHKPPSAVRDFPWGCGSEKEEDYAQVKPFEDDVELQSPGVLENFSETELDCFLVEEEDDKDSVMEHFGNDLESPLHKGRADFAYSELPCDENSDIDGELEDFAPSELPCVDNSEVLENFAKSESPGLMMEDFDNVGLQKPSKTSEQDLEEKRIKYYPPWRLRGISAVRDFPLGCGRKPRVFRDDTENQSHEFQVEIQLEMMPKMDDTKEKNATSCNSKFYQPEDVGGVHDNTRTELQFQREEPFSSKLPMGRVVVLALMAAPNCPWRNAKRVGKSTTDKRGATGGKKIH